jgi:hypothetical protein
LIDGWCLLDGTLAARARSASPRVSSSQLGSPAGRRRLRGGRGPPYLPIGSSPAFYAEADALALLAALAPEERSPHTRIPMTNRALLGCAATRDFVASPLFAATVGEPVGATYGGTWSPFAERFYEWAEPQRGGCLPKASTGELVGG